MTVPSSTTPDPAPPIAPPPPLASADTRRRSLRLRDEFGFHRGRPFLTGEPVIVTSTIDYPAVAIAHRRVYLPV